MRLDGFEVHEHLALVVSRSSRVDLAVPDGCLERRRRPQLERVHGLNIVVTVEQDRRSARRFKPIAVDHRIAGRLDETHVLETDTPHFSRAPFGAPAHVGCVLWQRRNTWNREQRLQLVEVAIAIEVDEIDDLVHGRLLRRFRL